MNSKLSEKWKRPRVKGPITFSIKRKRQERSEIRRNVPELKEMDEEEEEEEVDENPFTDVKEEKIVLDPAIVFPYSNNGTRATTIKEESEQWESLFDPQYTFGPFMNSVMKPSTTDYYYKGKWPLNQADIMGMAPKQMKKTKQNSDDGESVSPTDESYLFSMVPDPLLPDLEQLKLLLTDMDDHDEDTRSDGESTAGSVRQIGFLPSSSISLHTRRAEEDASWEKRLNLLDTIQQAVFNEDLNGTRENPFQGSRAARIQRSIRDKAERIKKEAWVDVKNDSRENMAEEGTKEDKESKEKDLKFLSRISGLLGGYQEKAFDYEEELQECKQKNRYSFLYFALGFLFPPLWILGATYSPKASQQQTEASKDIDKKWKKYSRNALFIFLLITVVTVIIVVIAEPASFGFRETMGDQVHEDIVIFDGELVLEG
ncbi:hypothetical protein CU097_007118 [Rhizopus azygosporus]|uniref:Uncharacterized protein n=1 Tax=Rhizopus azygosporus TaxID=86630 RepID=A0A367J975_RHIAZ|nr:hypothetical protein CU097_007118 [Rhizopus azygosporus]